MAHGLHTDSVPRIRICRLLSSSSIIAAGRITGRITGAPDTCRRHIRALRSVRWAIRSWIFALRRSILRPRSSARGSIFWRGSTRSTKNVFPVSASCPRGSRHTNWPIACNPARRRRWTSGRRRRKPRVFMAWIGRLRSHSDANACWPGAWWSAACDSSSFGAARMSTIRSTRGMLTTALWTTMANMPWKWKNRSLG